ncbi:hypothetical protein BS329_09420 [Amycolatopsis coloradensis]|uniref:DUF6292 domain-containing protein n=1 Tax=Amycolatopsis coloradensis TaxID=76021 RepID=A0A1R0KZB8_9PSEU|nr:DUF6292 family protein [Amycolatopsis coloradensis]OLZ54703.1 hypothetical protein BS329_09420 [Amycolatopsis coloradensis]
MESGFGEAVIRGLHRYVRSVINELGIRGDAFYAQLEPTAGAYIALDRRLPDHPDQDVALVWDERYGWSVALETNSSEDLVMVAYHGLEILPSPAAVAAFTREVWATENASRSSAAPAGIRENDVTLAERLTGYLRPVMVISPHEAAGPRGSRSPSA